MQIKLQNKTTIDADNCRYYNVHLIDIDNNRTELNDTYGMVIGTIEADNDFKISTIQPNPIEDIKETIKFKNGAIIIAEKCDFYDIYKIRKNDDIIEVYDKNDNLDGKIYIKNYNDIDIIEYDENGCNKCGECGFEQWE